MGAGKRRIKLSTITIDRNRAALPSLTSDNQPLPEGLAPLGQHLEAIRGALDGLNAEARKIQGDTTLSATGRAEKLASVGQAAIDGVSAKFDKPIELIRGQAEETLANAMRKATSGLDATRVTILAERIGSSWRKQQG
jgi:hypothetical protein